MRPIFIIILHLLFNDKLMLIDIGNQRRLIKIWQIDNQMYLSINMYNSLLQLISSCMYNNRYIVVPSQPKIQLQWIIYFGDEDIVITLIP